MQYPLVYLNKNADKRLRQGHLWIYSNEIDAQRSSLKDLAQGEKVFIHSSNGSCLGTGYLNPHNLLAGRILSPTTEQIDTEWFIVKLGQALALRNRCFDKPYYRMVYADGDYLPGLIIDRFGDTLVVQLNTAGMDQCRNEIISALDHLLPGSRIVLKNDSPYRKTEGLELNVDIINGDERDLIIHENDHIFHAPVHGQKTGWFYDHRMNRNLLTTFTEDKDVLDLFCYCGGWSIPALRNAKSVTAVDASALALEYCNRNASTLNNNKLTTVKSDVMSVLETYVSDSRQFDVIILDPPALIKKKKDWHSGHHAYKKLHQLAIRCLRENGILISASCSFFLSKDDLQSIVHQASWHNKRSAQVISYGMHAMDHPIHPAIPETDYLCTVFSSIL